MNSWEVTLYLITLLLGLAPLFLCLTKSEHRKWGIVVGGVAVCMIGPILFYPFVDSTKPISLNVEGVDAIRYLPRIVQQDGFVSSDQCRSCHPSHYNSWHDSYHRTMTQVATPLTVLASFEQQTLTASGVTCRLERRGDEFWAEMPDMDIESAMLDSGLDLYDQRVRQQIPNVWRRIVMTTGSHHFQGYWVASRRGLELLQFPFIFSIRDQRWVPVEDVFIRPPGGSRRLAVWNTNCIQCHSLDGKPGWENGTYTSSVAELGISCEACHGPGAEHVQKQQNPLARYIAERSDKPDSTIVNPANCTPAMSSQICGQCHSSFITKDVNDWAANGLGFRAGDSLESKRHILYFNSKRAHELNADIAAAAYWQDGTSRAAGREYMAMIESPCYQHEDTARQISCLSCHSMHDSEPDDQLGRRMDSNEACLQCHSSFREHIEDHTHHPRDSTGSLCYNCHMPHSSYGLLKAIRSHRIESPNVSVSSRTGKPNGCNQCHVDKTLAWTGKYLSSWYEVEPAELTDDEKQVSASILWLLRGDAAQRAISAWTFGWEPAREISGFDWMLPYLAQVLDDPYSAVRFIAFDSLRKHKQLATLSYDYLAPQQERFDIVRKLFLEWEYRSAGRLSEGEPWLLINSDGSLNQDEFRRLFSQRDNKPIEFPE